MTQTRILAVAWLIGSTLTLFATAAGADCRAPAYRMGYVVTDSPTEALLQISIRPKDFAPGRLVCLVDALKRRYPDRPVINVFIFSSPVAAKFFRAYEIDHDAITTNKVEGRFHARDLHAIYLYDAAKRQEYLDIKPQGDFVATSSDARITLPSSATPHCRNEINNRCLWSLDDWMYPRVPETSRSSGAVTISGRITPEGKVTELRVVETTASTEEERSAFAREALANLKTWRFEEAPRSDPFRITYSWVIDESLPRGHQPTELALPTQVRMRANPANR